MFVYAKREKLRNLFFIISDALCIVLFFHFSYYLKFNEVPGIINMSNVEYTQVLTLIMMTNIFAAIGLDIYGDISQRSNFKEAKVILKQNIVMMFMFLMYTFLSRQNGLSRRVYVTFFLLNIVGMWIMRAVSKWFLRKISPQKKERLYIVTDYEHLFSMIKRIKAGTEYELEGLIIVDRNLTGQSFCGVPVVANIDNLYDFVKCSVVDSVFIHLPDDADGMHHMAEILIDMGIIVHINIPNLPYYFPNKAFHTIENLTVVSGSMRIASPAQAAAKRAIDIIGAVVGLLITGVITLIIGPLIRLESPGPIFFKQTRVGKNGRKFTIYKFRSMYADAETKKEELMQHNKINGFMFKIDKDPRVTKIGRFIRKTSIDELPQFLNVLKGDMSLVGTRPPTLDEYNRYELHHKKRLGMKPGLTGFWQVNGRSNVIDFEKVVQMDTDYITHWSLKMDLQLILKTVGILFGDRNAY